MTKKTKGHWPKGVRRNADAGGWSKTRLALQALLDRYHERERVSARQLASDLQVSDRTVRRWIAGEDRPDPEYQELIRAWVVDHGPKNTKGKTRKTMKDHRG